MTTKINSGTKKTERRFAEVIGAKRPVNDRHNGDRNPLTLGDLHAFVLAAEGQGVPSDAPVEVPAQFGFGGGQTLAHLVVDVQVEVED